MVSMMGQVGKSRKKPKETVSSLRESLFSQIPPFISSIPVPAGKQDWFVLQIANVTNYDMFTKRDPCPGMFSSKPEPSVPIQKGNMIEGGMFRFYNPLVVEDVGEFFSKSRKYIFFEAK